MSIPYLVQRGNQYYFQIRLPADIQPFFQCSQIKKSLRTRSVRQATTLVKVLTAEIEKAFFMIRSGLLTPQMILDICTDVKERMLEVHRQNSFEAPNRSQTYRQFAAELKTQLQNRDYSSVQADACMHLASRNISVEASSQEFKTLCDGLLRTEMRVSEVIADREEGNLRNGYDDGLIMRVREQKYRLTELMDDYISMSGKTWEVRTRGKKDDNFKKVLEIWGDINTVDINKDRVQHLYEELKNYPVNRCKNPYAPLTLDECRKLPTFRAMHQTTFKDTWHDVSSLLLFGSENDKYKIARNYAADRVFRITKGKGGEPTTTKRAVYSPYDIECLFRGLAKENRVRQPQRYWIPLIGLYQGMRQNEICQLYCDDVLEVDGIPCIRITDNVDRNQHLIESNLKSVKNEQSRRTIPVHPTLIQLGFLDFVASRRKQKCVKVWEKLKTPAVDYYAKQGNHSHYVSKWYCDTFRKNHIVVDPELKPFHSLRHSFIDWHFQNVKNLDFTAVKGLVGHVDNAEQKILGALFNGVTWREYAKEVRPERLLEALIRLDYGVDLKLLKRKYT